MLLADIYFTIDHHFNFPISRNDPVAQIAMFIVALSTVMMGVSRTMGDLLTKLLSLLLTWSFKTTSERLTAKQQSILDQMPATRETVMNRFNLEPKTTTFAVCPSCHCNYAPTFSPGSEEPKYPAQCKNVLPPAPAAKGKDLPPPAPIICGTDLLDTDSKPLKTFVYPHFHDYLAGLLARADLEDMMDSACDDLMSSIRRNEGPPDIVEDVLQAEFVRRFQGPDAKTLFVDRPNGKGRYLFAIFFDFFSAEGQTIRGASASCGLISGACLNLPLSHRFKPELMYNGGVIPGPEEPHGTALNYYIQPLVSDLKISWEDGVHYSRTARYPQGKDTNSAMIISLNDLPAARKISQCASHASHHFCSRCYCHGLENIGRTDITHPDWRTKDCSEQRRWAEEWKNATTHAGKSKLFAQHGLRWTEFWRLPYWNPADMLVVDSMHCLLEGLAQHHFRKVLELTDKDAKVSTKAAITNAFAFNFLLPTPEDITKRSLSSTDVKHIPLIHHRLLAPISDDDDDIIEQGLAGLHTYLKNKNLGALKFISETIPAPPPGAGPEVKKIPKERYAAGLVHWVRIIIYIFKIV